MEMVSRLAATASATPGYDMYAGIHKPLRAFMSDILTLVGRCDWEDEVEAGRALAQLRDLLAICEVHMHDENVSCTRPSRRAGRPATRCTSSSRCSWLRTSCT